MPARLARKAVIKADAAKDDAMQSSTVTNGRLLIGRAEWCELPELKIPGIKAKVDTGAKTSAVHALNIKYYRKQTQRYVSFDVHPIQSNTDVLVHCRAPLVEKRYVMSSNGQKEHRPVIQTTLVLGDQQWLIELTLSNREPLRYRLLLGREALAHRVVIDPALNCHLGQVCPLDLYKPNAV